MPNCNQCQSPFDVTEADRAFYKRVGVPEPTLCPACRLRRKLAFRNERNLYHAKCAISGKSILTMYPPESGYSVLAPDVWWSDKWDPLEHGRLFDFSRHFFEQYHALDLAVPKCNLYNFDHENSEYCNYACHNKNCFLLFGSWFSENCLHGNTVLHSHNSHDCLFAEKCDNCYELTDCNDCFELFFSQGCDHCSGSLFLFNCRNCPDCVGCANLVNKKHYLFNRPSTKAEIDAIKNNLNCGSLAKLRASFETLKEQAVRRFMTGTNNQNVTGDFIYNSRDVREGFVIYDCQDVAYTFRASKGQKDSYDLNGCSGGELIYDSLNNDFSHNSAFLMNGEHNADSFYCSNCYQSGHCFGCDGLRHKQFCILNKQYPREEYEALAPRIINHMQKTGEWGEFFPISISPFPYNETIAQDYYPLDKEAVSALGGHWKDAKKEAPKVKKIIPASALPDSIAKIPDDILNWAIECESSGRPFRVVQSELVFYRKYGLPVPRFHPDIRHLNRLRLRNPPKLWPRACAKCAAPIQTTYSPDRPEKVYCEQCYLKEVY